MEVKHELVRGELSSPRRAALPLAAALGGVVVPAALYLAITWGTAAARGFGIPVATDIAFALAILALLGPRCPAALKVLVLAFAVIDDVVGVLVIAFFYGSGVSVSALALAGLGLLAVALLRGLGVRSTAIHLPLGVAVWACVLASGVHATIAGVLLGALVPARAPIGPAAFGARAESLIRAFRESWNEEERLREDSPAGGEAVADARARRDRILGELEERLEGMEAPSERLGHLVNPWVGYLVLPVFALANAGVALSPDSLERAVASPVLWAIAAGLLVGKPVGVVAGCWLAVTLRLARLPDGIGWRHVSGMGVLAGIGFTVSLFIDQLAFSHSPALLDASKISVLGASCLAGVAAFAILRFSAGRS